MAKRTSVIPKDRLAQFRGNPGEGDPTTLEVQLFCSHSKNSSGWIGWEELNGRRPKSPHRVLQVRMNLHTLKLWGYSDFWGVEIRDDSTVPKGWVHVDYVLVQGTEHPMLSAGANTARNFGPYTYDPTRPLEEYKEEMRRVIDGLTEVPEWTVIASNHLPNEVTRFYHHGRQVGFLKAFKLAVTLMSPDRVDVDAECHYGRIPQGRLARKDPS